MTCKCQIPPEGWTCSRKPGHEGPCAADPEIDRIDFYYQTPEGRFILIHSEFRLLSARREPWYTRVWNWIKREV